MALASIREELRQQLETIPDELIREIADFTAFVLARRKSAEPYFEWDEKQWESFTLLQFFHETDDVEYTIDDVN